MSEQAVEAHRHHLSRDYARGLSETLAKHLSLDACRHGYMLYFNTDLYVGNSLEVYGEWTEVESQLFEQIVKPGMTVLEAGSNVGAHTVSLAKLAGPAGKLYAFEPQRRIFQIMCANLALNDIGNVYAYQMGLGSEAGKMFLAPADYTAKDNFAGLSLARTGIEQVEIGTIDSFELAALDFLKIDVEAMEMEVLKGGTATIARHRPMIFIENDRVDGSSSIIETLFGMHYRCWWHISAPYNKHNYFQQSQDVWRGLGESNNMICVAAERCTPEMLAILAPYPEAQDASETWETVLKGRTRLEATP
jgi:FkbM family methyltransferase